LDFENRYGLANTAGTFAADVVETLLQLMTEPEHRGTAVILAGYKKEMYEFLNTTNQGFARRFDEVVNFPDWTPKECANFLREAIRDDGYAIDPQADKQLENQFQQMYDHNPDRWSNAADAAKVYQRAKSNNLLRGGAEPILDGSDFKYAFDGLLQLRPTAKTKNSPNIDPKIVNSSLFKFLNDNKSRVRVVEKEKENEEESSNSNNENEGQNGGWDGEGKMPKSDDGMTSRQKEELRNKEKVRQEALKKEMERRAIEMKKKKEAEERARKERERLEKLLREKRDREEKERIRKKLEAARKREEAARRERERIKKQQEDARRKEQAYKKVLHLGQCEAGYGYTHVGNGWRCNAWGPGRGSHFVSDEQVKAMNG